ncbi:MAG: DUF1735 and LamG domain-containing protein [Bacteroidales bacterium]|nr:DUF1735 and LamG domain-containing protein [Bacteroidales bacterium]MBQ3613100.1 DUF1735 and LamG domain-containing protein [Bacteroidales bacterium]
MKKTIKIFALGLLSAAFFSCQDAKLPAIDNMVYISDAANGRISSVLMSEGNTEVIFSVRLAQAVSEDVKVTVSMDPSVLENYNNTYGTTYRHVEAENIEAPAMAVIPAGSVSSDPIKVSILPFETMGAQYALSIRVTSNGDIPVAEESSKYIIQLMKPLKQLVPKFRYDNAMQAAPITSDWNLELMNYTLEWWVRMTGKYSDDQGLNINNQAIINSGSGTRGCELYIRFGDLVYSSGWSYDNRFLQIKTMGGQFDTGNPTQGKALTSGKWYHFAITYDGNKGESILYQDGVPVNTLNTGAGRAMWIDRFQMCSSGSQYFPNQAEMCQVRLWKTTRTADQISKNMRSEVEYKHPDLLMYIPMNEGPGATTLADVTENGHDVVIGSLPGTGSRNEAYAWTEYAF